MSEFERLKVSAGETLMAKGRQVDHGRARVGWLGTCRLWLPCRRRWENDVKFKYSKRLLRGEEVRTAFGSAEELASCGNPGLGSTIPSEDSPLALVCAGVSLLNETECQVPLEFHSVRNVPFAAGTASTRFFNSKCMYPYL